MKHLLLIYLTITGIALFAQSPCTTNDNYRAFDFWLGKWDVYQDGKLAGTNDVRLVLDSCVIMENWESAQSEYKGKSFNYPDGQTNTWHQTWVDNRGGYLWFEGRREGNKLKYTGKSTDKDGKTVHHEMTFTHNKDGSVRQYWRSSKDKESWNVLFDGLYIPRGADIENYGTGK